MATNPLEVTLTDFIKPCEKLTDYIKVYDNAFDDELCERIITSFESEPQNQVSIDRMKRPKFTELNISQQYNKRNTNWMVIQSEVQSCCIEHVSKYMDELDLGPDFPPKYVFEEYRIKRYRSDKFDEFADHVDVGDYNSARRFLVCFLYLNDVPEGGTTDFPKLNYSVTPKRGRMLIFPPTWMYRHSGRPVIDGKKYILGTYLQYL